MGSTGSPVASTALSITSGTLAYDNRGNTTTLADQAINYDQSDRHVTTIVAGGPTIGYVRDVKAPPGIGTGISFVAGLIWMRT